MKMVSITLPEHVDEAIQRFLDHEVVRVEDAPPGRYDDEHLREVKRLRHAYEGGSRAPSVVVNVPQDGAIRVVHPENVKEILVEWHEIENTGSLFFVEKLVEEIQSLPGLEENRDLQELLADLKERVIALKLQG
jgi:hypothetical protein